jgi:hypothetical protein
MNLSGSMPIGNCVAIKKILRQFQTLFRIEAKRYELEHLLNAIEKSHQ